MKGPPTDLAVGPVYIDRDRSQAGIEATDRSQWSINQAITKAIAIPNTIRKALSRTLRLSILCSPFSHCRLSLRHRRFILPAVGLPIRPQSSARHNPRSRFREHARPISVE